MAREEEYGDKMYEPNPKDFNDLDENDFFKKKLNIISPNEFENEIKVEFIMFSLFVKEVSGNTLIEPLKKVSAMLKEFKDICSSKLYNYLSSMLDI